MMMLTGKVKKRLIQQGLQDSYGWGLGSFAELLGDVVPVIMKRCKGEQRRHGDSAGQLVANVTRFVLR